MRDLSELELDAVYGGAAKTDGNKSKDKSWWDAITEAVGDFFDGSGGGGGIPTSSSQPNVAVMPSNHPVVFPSEATSTANVTGSVTVGVPSSVTVSVTDSVTNKVNCGSCHTSSGKLKKNAGLEP